MTTTNEGTQRDELAQTLKASEADHSSLERALLFHREVASDLIAAGYRKPRTITTVEELDALPDGAIYLSGHREVMRANGAGWDPSNLDSGGLADPADITLPATVIWEPEVLVAA